MAGSRGSQGLPNPQQERITSGVESGKWDHLHLTAWPFQILPDERFLRIWADRSQLREQVDRMLWRWSRPGPSTLHLMWADLGAGKTHTLRHIQLSCLESTRFNILPVYAALPKYMRTFVEVYQSVLVAFDRNVLRDSFLASQRELGRRSAADKFFPSIPDAEKALQLLAEGSDQQQQLAMEWLRGSRLYKRDLELIGAARYLRTADDAVAVLSGLIQLVLSTGEYGRVLVMLDECQRLGNLKLQIGRDINTGLRSWLEACPRQLSLVMSFGSGKEQYVKHLLTDELLTLVDHQRLRLDLLSRDDAIQFISDLLAVFRVPDSPSQFFPFDQDGVKAIVNGLVDSRGITPRELMKGFDALLTEADYLLGTGREFAMDTQSAVRLAQEAIAELKAKPEE